ncbi:MAG: L,D-transpeptidase family protein [Planctomycetes bacterium]|nr:L,D-transpeptidase family protein [Planctomycetota bacterium]
MRNLLFLLLVGGIAFLGYEYGKRRSDDGTAAAKTKDDTTEKASKTAAGRPDFGSLSLDTSGMRLTNGTTSAGAGGVGDPERVEVVADVSESFANDTIAKEADRYVAALDARDFSKLTPSTDLRDEFPFGTTARFALEVALGLEQSPDDGTGERTEDLAKAASLLLATAKNASVVDRVTGAFEILTSRGHLGRALAATGGRNHFLAGKGGGAACGAWVTASQRLEDPVRAVALSGLLDAMTRGPVPIWRQGASFALLRDAYAPLQSVLKTLVFNPNGSWKSRYENVEKGVYLSTIANRCEREWGIPMSPGLLQRINGLSSPKSLRAGSRIRVPTERIRVVVDKSTFSMKVYLGDVILRLYEVGLGEDGSTPETEFTVTEKQLDPQWTNPRTGVTYPALHPENLIGRYFIRLEDGVHMGFGIHGTKDQTSIGKNSSMGCIRLRERDIEDVFSYLPRRTKVVIRA